MLRLEFAEHTSVVATGGNRGSFWSWLIRNGSGHVVARSGDPFASKQAARVDARFAILSIKENSVDEARSEDAAKGAKR